MAESSKLYLQGEIRLDSGAIIPVKRHYGYAWADGAPRNASIGDGFTVFVPIDAPLAQPGQEGELLLLKTVSRHRMRVETVNKLGTEVRLVCRLLPKSG